MKRKTFKETGYSETNSSILHLILLLSINPTGVKGNQGTFHDGIISDDNQLILQGKYQDL